MPTSLQAPFTGEHFPLGATALPHYDVAIVGGGPVGSFCALAHARKGARVALLEANPKAVQRLAGEWLHPPAVSMLRSVGVNLDGRPGFFPGKGFVVFPEDRSESILLPYPAEATGLVFEHSALVSRLHEAVENESGIDVYHHARARAIEDEGIVFGFNGTERLLQARRIVGADGRASIVRQSLGLTTDRMTCSRMIGVMAEGVNLQHEGFGYVVLGGPGPILTVPLGEDRVRIIADMPLDHWTPRERIGVLLESYAACLPEDLRCGFEAALRKGKFQAAANELRPRISYGNSRRVLIGDAAGHYHPMTAAGMTLGFGDALALAEGGNFRDFANRRLKATRAPQLLAMGLYEVFRDHRLESAVLRQAVYRNWRASKLVRTRTMRLLACKDASVTRLGTAFSGTVLTGVAGEFMRRRGLLTWRRARGVIRALAVRLWWLVAGVRELRKARSPGGGDEQTALDKLSRAFVVSMQEHAGAREPERNGKPTTVDAGPGLSRAVRRLLDLQRADGAWEGEMTWCPMLAAQYVLLHYITGQPIGPQRRRLLLRQFERTRLPGGQWGLHEHSQPYLFVTALVYVAARLLDVERDDPLISPARDFLQNEGVLNIPSWGKFWLALLNLYDWRGVNAILPELWMLPRRLPLHPSNWYCHTRLIYMAMATIYSSRFQVQTDPIIETLRDELYPEGFANVDFAAGRNRLRAAELFARPGIWLRAGFALTRIYERIHGKRLRARCREELIERIRWELRCSSHTSISPVSGFLNILALWLRDPDDGDFRKAVESLEGWIWEDEENGTRITGARSTSWDTGFALQALAAAPGIDGAQDALKKGADFLRGQQVPESFDGYREAFRNDPKGGWCFAGKWHGWPVTDCTAEAVLGIIAADSGPVDEAALDDAVRFMLSGQNRDGGFGSYEARRTRTSLKWLNPAEMFGESMTESSYVECTASCLAALAACKRRYPGVVNETALNAMSRADAWLRRSQAVDGSWRGVWGVQFIYGVMFGIRGLIAGGARPEDPALRLACRWLLDRQRSDGGWGEHHGGCLTGAYVAHEEGQIIQTAWALIALLEAGESNWAAISRGAQFLLDAQEKDGGWPKQDMAGVFFRTALLDYELYRQYFPLHAIGLYERRRRARQAEYSLDRPYRQTSRSLAKEPAQSSIAS
ncbi:MAG: FAD-dependent oxidoreductase [Gammaproteobacteria bacterium]|nr:FAD-dependent oxidoreductase [Gammaproteobacteria bacterium]MYH47170.1 FAD-dependent oxidoreductase [Gammaproteobacteria bacterium]MYL12889.1 FAD-dependent oxidoreductase [Gammaproteobacteria bacterium]